MPSKRVGNAHTMHIPPERLRRVWELAKNFVAYYPIGKSERANLLETEWGHGSMGNHNNPTGRNQFTK